MWKLKKARVSRAGVTATSLNYETSECVCGVDSYGVRFRFDIASKGGGRTMVQLHVGVADLPRMIDEVCVHVPEAEEMLLAAVTEAIRRRRVAEQDAEKATEETRAERERIAIDADQKFSKIRDYLSEQYAEKPSGEDQREKELTDLADEVDGALWDLRWLT